MYIYIYILVVVPKFGTPTAAPPANGCVREPRGREKKNKNNNENRRRSGRKYLGIQAKWYTC